MLSSIMIASGSRVAFADDMRTPSSGAVSAGHADGVAVELGGALTSSDGSADVEATAAEATVGPGDSFGADDGAARPALALGDGGGEGEGEGEVLQPPDNAAMRATVLT